MAAFLLGHYPIGTLDCLEEAKMRVRNWYKSDGWGAFREFCIENRYDLISAKQIDEPEPVKGALYDYRFWPISTAGVSILLAYTVIHPAFYPWDELESLHYMGPSTMWPSSYLWPDRAKPGSIEQN